ncbi:MAG TPA: adenylyltransferase/cytidyltransferase family protein [Thermohalobaculum sp.]|nr:adenylyltransferase/cytidyltransferase family protein [Thermohalobaculum sp.]
MSEDTKAPGAGRPVRVFTTMVGDLFHHGHVNFLRAARALGDHLTVGLVSDRRAASYKRPPVMAFAERRAVVEACRHVNAVIELDENVTDDFMRAHGFGIRAYGVASEAEEARNFRTLWKDMDPGWFRRIDYTPGVSTTEIIARVLARPDLRGPGR